MEAKESKIQDILTENKKYIIPPYQRPYSWSRDNAEQLIDDIYQSYLAGDEEYFIGSMICINRGGNCYEVVDGQQRLTTLSLIFAQLKNHIDNRGIKDDLQKRVLPIDVYSDEANEPRLVVRDKESSLYQYYILQGNQDYKPEKPSHTEALFMDNSRAIGDYIDAKTQGELRNLARFILQNVFVVFVQTSDLASSFRLFNVLNNRGMPLSNADLLKNALFEAAAGKKGAPQVEQAWSDIEDIVGVEALDKFLSLHKLSEKKDRDRVLQMGLDSFINSLKTDFGGNPVEMSLLLLHSAKNYLRIRENDFDDSATKRRIASLTQLSTDEWLPPLMAFLNRLTRQKDLSWPDFSEFVSLFEKVYMHGWLKKQIKSQREMVCYSALVAINNGKSRDEILQHVREHADNAGFVAALNDDLYEPRPNQVNLVKTILLRIDQERQDESVIKTYTGRITIEHILPQKFSHPYWIERFNDDEHARWLHKLGNLTLISGSKNSEARNSDFDTKKAIYAKLNNRVSFDITKELCDIEHWSPDTVFARHKNLSAVLKEIWLV